MKNINCVCVYVEAIATAMLSLSILDELKINHLIHIDSNLFIIAWNEKDEEEKSSSSLHIYQNTNHLEIFQAEQSQIKSKITI